MTDCGSRGFRWVGWNAVVTAALVAGGMAAPGRLPAQVGHAPGSSPYRDIRKGHMLTVLYGHFGGSGGRFGIAPHDATTYGLRYDLRTGSTVQVGIGVARSDLQRLIVDPFVAIADRVSGPVQQQITFGELVLQLNVTGGKSWNRLAPFLGAGAGLTFPTTTPGDTSRFKFGRKFYFAPYLGTRVFLTDRLSIRGEARAVFWKIKYPTTFQDEPALQPGTPPDNSNAVIPDGRVTEWSASPWLQVGLAYGFSP